MDVAAKPKQIRSTMPAVVFDSRLRLVADRPVPVPPHGWALIRTHTAGICGTDLEIIKGYMGYHGVLGHEFVGEVYACDDPRWIGKLVAGEINAACGACRLCRQGLARHCPERSVLGISGHDGCMAAYCTLPVANLHAIPAGMRPDRAVFVEPVSAACEILAQVPLEGTEKVAVLGDGRLGLLCAWVLATVCEQVTLVGHHREKLALAAWRTLKTTRDIHTVAGADIVVEATGNVQGFKDALSICRPRGTLVLKSTLASRGDLNLAPVVINELTIVGSRCGLFAEGLALLAEERDMPVERLITGKYPFDRALQAFAAARAPGALKILLEGFHT